MTDAAGNEPKLAFLVSLPRSGSTLLQHLLARNRRVATSPEPWIMLHPIYGLRRQGVQAEFESAEARNALDAYLDAIGAGEELYLEALRAFGRVLYAAALEGREADVFLDKTPRYYHVLPELHRIFPEARFVCLWRNPLAVLSSVLKTWFRNDPSRLARAYNRIDLFNGPGLLLAGSRQLGDAAHHVRYEGLVTQPESTLRGLCDFLGLEFSEAMLRYDPAATRRRSARQPGDPTGIQGRDRPDTDSLELWAGNLREAGLKAFALDYLERLGEPTVSAMGYEFDALRQRLQAL